MAQIIKILEATLTAGATTLTVTNAAIPYSIIAVNCDKYGTYPANMTVSGTTLTLTYEVQSEDLHLAISLIKADLAVIDDLTSDSETDALSAAQGKALKALIDNIVVTGTLAGLEDVDLSSLTAGDILVYDGINEKWVNASQPTIPSDLTDLDDVTITSPANGDTLIYDNGAWKNGVPASGVSYVATETKIGTYLGQDLYRQIFTGLSITLNQNAWTTLSGINIPNGKDLVNAVCYGTYTEQYIINCTKVHLNSADGTIELRNVESSTTLTAIMLEYTKAS